MLLGKRARHPMKRTTSMTEFSFDDLSVLHPPPSDHHPIPAAHAVDPDHHHHRQRVVGLVSPRMIHRRNSTDHFLRTCSLCNRRLAPGRDIYMYRGDSAFCSLECRQQQMTQDEWREKCSNKESSSSSSHSSTAGSIVASAQGDTVAAL